MPQYEAPQNDQTRLLFMKTAVSTGTADRINGNNYVSEAILAAMSDLIIEYEAAYNYVNTMLSQRTQDIRLRDEHIRRLETYVRDFWEVLRRRINRLEQPVSLLQQYGLPLDGTTPPLRTPGECLSAANIIIAGEAMAVGSGYPAMINPSASEISSLLTPAQNAQNNIATADRNYDQAQEALAALRPQADALIQEVVDELRYVLRKRDTPSRRRIIRTYGGTYTYSAGESAEAEE